jgi:single-strand DNA-binding protein
MELTGKIARIEKTEQVSEKFKKRRIIVETTIPNNKYSQTLEFTLVQGNVDAANALNVGDEARVQFELKGREVTDKNSKKIVFNTLEAYRFDVIKKAVDFVQAPETPNNYSDDEPLPF